MATIYANKDNGDLKLIGEADDDGTSPALLIDLLLDQETRLRDREFTVITPDGTFVVSVNGDEPVNPRRDIEVNQLGATSTKSTRRSTRKAAPEPEAEDDDGEEEKPKAAPRRRAARAKAGTARKATAKKAAKSTAKPKVAAKSAAKKGSPFKRNAASEGE